MRCWQQDAESFLELSDEEVLAASQEDTSKSEDTTEDYEDFWGKAKSKTLGKPFQDSESENFGKAQDEEDIGGWGSSEKDYYKADAIETEADAIEDEAEARRLQQKQLQNMTEGDFGFDEVYWLEEGKNEDHDTDAEENRAIREILPKLEITDAMGPEEKMRIMKLTCPEFEPLAKEFVDLQELHGDLQLQSAAAEKKQSTANGGITDSIDLPLPVATVKHRALTAYLSALSMYFALLTSATKGLDGKATVMPPEQLRDHDLINALVQCRDLWGKVQDIEVPEPAAPILDGHIASNQDGGTGGVNDQISHYGETQTMPKRRKQRPSKSQRQAEAVQAEAEAQYLARIQDTEASIADLFALTTSSKLLSFSKPTGELIQPTHDSDSDIGDPTALTPSEAAEKAKRKKSLRFYTSQIAQKSNKREAAGRDAGGDADLPYRERLKDGQARLNAEAEKRGNKDRSQGPGEELGEESDEDDRSAAKEQRDDGSGSEDYYNFVSSQAAKKKEEKAALSALHPQAKAEGGVVRVIENENFGKDGKRAISYAIKKNKGLVVKREKDVRNPRVKKRKKFEEKKKKLGSIRPIYKGGEGRGGYGGELTGINTWLVKGVKLWLWWLTDV